MALTLRVLGDIEVLRDAETLALPRSKKTRALLAYLAVTNRPHRRDRLCSLFWDIPDDPRGSLRWSLSKLRGLVDDADTKRIVADRETVAFDSTGVQFDLGSVRDEVSGGLAAVPTDRLAALAAYFRGSFLEGLDLPDCHEYQAWCVSERAEAQSLSGQVLGELIARSANDPNSALAYARAWIESDPGSEPARTSLVRLLAAAGRRSEAEEQMAIGLRQLDKLGAEISDDFLGLRREIGAPSGPADTPAAGSEVRVAADPVTPPPSRADTNLPNQPTIAVLPFENLSNDPTQDYFADGITEDVITALSLWRWFPVIARNSTFSYKGKNVDVVKIGEELGARYIVEGSVRKADDRIRISAQLIDASNGHTLWGQRYDRAFEDVFSVQDEISEQIVTNIEPELARAEQRRAHRKRPENLDAWDLTLKALAHVHAGGRDDYTEARRLLDESLALDPRSSFTFAVLAFSLFNQALLGWADDPVAASQGCMTAAAEATSLDDGNWLAHALLGIATLWNTRDYERALEEGRKALDLNPSAAMAHQFHGCVLTFAGDPAGAATHLRSALKLNPLSESATLLLADMALCHLMCGEPEEARACAEKAIGEFSGNMRARQRLVAALGQLDRPEEAAVALAELIKRQNDFSRDYVDATYPFRDSKQLDVFLEGLRKAGWNG